MTKEEDFTLQKPITPTPIAHSQSEQILSATALAAQYDQTTPLTPQTISQSVTPQITPQKIPTVSEKTPQVTTQITSDIATPKTIQAPSSKPEIIPPSTPKVIPPSPQKPSTSTLAPKDSRKKSSLSTPRVSPSPSPTHSMSSMASGKGKSKVTGRVVSGWL